MGELPNSQVPHYDMEKHLWLLKLKDWDKPLKGAFTSFATQEELFDGTGETCFYPLNAKQHFAFVPINHWKEWEPQLRYPLNVDDIPEYIIMFRAHEIESLSIVPPVN
jgi:hypothetical protein